MRLSTVILLLTVLILSLFALENKGPGSTELEYYISQHQAKPLFAFEGSDPSELEHSIKNLKKSLSLSISYFPEETKQYTRKILFPIEFLETLPMTEMLRVQLSTKPSLIEAKKYHFSLLKTIYIYKKNAQDMVYVLDSLDNHDLFFLNGSTNVNFYSTQLKLAIQMANKRGEEEKRRFKCLLKISSSCRIEPKDIPTDKIHVEDKESTPREILSQNKNIIAQSVVNKFTAFSKTTKSIGSLPTIFLNDGICRYSNDIPAIMFWWSSSRISDSETIRINPINDLLFNDLSEANGNYYETLNKSGLKYQHQPLNPYLCPDFGHDASLVLTSHYIQNDLMHSPLFSVAAKDTDILLTELASLEKNIISSTSFLDTRIVEGFIEKVKLLLETSNPDTLTLTFGNKNVDRLFSLVTVWKGKSAWSEHLIGNIDDMGLTAVNVSRKQEIPLYALFLTRSYIDTLFFLSNETIVDFPLLLTEKRGLAPIKNFHFRSYNDDLISQIPPQDAAEFISDTRLKVNLIMSPEFYLSE
ncbi:hypothetical protein HQ403_01960 [Candidatus Kaiserbacteria bacterium]|nr:hypothetical protein [Candidatus Kaiserbacteria bacterium]